MGVLHFVVPCRHLLHITSIGRNKFPSCQPYLFKLHELMWRYTWLYKVLTSFTRCQYLETSQKPKSRRITVDITHAGLNMYIYINNYVANRMWISWDLRHMSRDTSSCDCCALFTPVLEFRYSWYSDIRTVIIVWNHVNCTRLNDVNETDIFSYCSYLWINFI